MVGKNAVQGNDYCLMPCFKNKKQQLIALILNCYNGF